MSKKLSDLNKRKIEMIKNNLNNVKFDIQKACDILKKEYSEELVDRFYKRVLRNLSAKSR